MNGSSDTNPKNKWLVFTLNLNDQNRYQSQQLRIIQFISFKIILNMFQKYLIIIIIIKKIIYVTDVQQQD